MKAIIIAAAMLAATLTSAHASECKGLDEATCTGAKASICNWMPARVAGEASPRTGKPYLRNTKAHCRIKGRRQQEAAAVSK
jgi:hypothetical protein